MSTLDVLIFTLVVGAVCGATPLFLGIFSSLVAGSYGKGKKTSHVLANSIGFGLGFLLVIFTLGTGFWALLNATGLPFSQYLCLVVAGLAIFAGIISVKDYFWPNQGYSHRPHKKIQAALHTKTTTAVSFANSVGLGMVSVAAAYTNTALSTLVISCILYVSGVVNPAVWVGMYGAALLFGVFCLALSVLGGAKISAITKWRHDSTPLMNLGSGLVLIIAAWTLLLLINTTITVGSGL